jgi:hypothetical protein
LVVVPSPLRLPLVIDVGPENMAKFPLAGEPVVVTVPPLADDDVPQVIVVAVKFR